MVERLDWGRDGADWPNRNSSRFVEAAGLRWHVQVMGQGPVAFLVHGTGASTHSWREFAVRLADRFTVVAPDLPGHGFTDPLPDPQMSLPGFSAALGALLGAMDQEPALAIGHSAGAAVLLRMSLDRLIEPKGLVSLNGALQSFRGVASQFFSPLAKILVINPFVPRIFAWRAEDRAAVERLIRGTGSNIDDQGLDLYQRLFTSPGHAAAALAMMANWDLDALEADLPKLVVPLLLIVGGGDTAVAPEQSIHVTGVVADSKLEFLRGLGHLAHEERPTAVIAPILRFAQSVGAL